MPSSQPTVLPSTLAVSKEKRQPLIYYATKYEPSIYYAHQCQISPSQEISYLKCLIAATKTALSSPGLQNDDPEFYLKLKEQLRHQERWLHQVQGGGSCQ